MMLFLLRRMLTLIILVGEFDIIIEFIIGSNFSKLIRRAETKHKRIKSIPTESGDFFHDIMREPVVNEFVVLIFNQSFLESQQSPVSFKTKHIYELIEIQANT